MKLVEGRGYDFRHSKQLSHKCLYQHLFTSLLTDEC